jgi:hypothetical protein
LADCLARISCRGEIPYINLTQRVNHVNAKGHGNATLAHFTKDSILGPNFWRQFLVKSRKQSTYIFF